jgi:methionyl-tRNA formyltransferase
MSNVVPARSAPRVLFFGMQGQFSSPSLAALLEQGIEVCSVVVPATPVPGMKLPAIQPLAAPRPARSLLPLVHTSLHPSIVQTARTRQIPVWEVSRLAHAETVSTLAAYQPDMICVACFSLLIPSAILKLPCLGCLNVHPSLLPANRGPMPLFWTFREGRATTGVTIHLMDEGMDSGDMLAQETIAVPDGISYDQLEMQCATQGGKLLARTVWDLYEGRAVRTVQDEAKSSYHSFPTDDDYVVQADAWDARHVYNFICAMASSGAPIELYAGDAVFWAQSAISYSHKAIQSFEGAYHQEGRELVVRCKVGQVRVLIA